MLDDASYNNDGSATVGTVTFTSPNLTWVGRVPATGSVTITYSVTVTNPDTGNSILASILSSTSTGSNCPAASTDPRCASTVTVSALLIVNTANVSTTTPGGVVVFTATFTNTGQTPYTGITISTSGSDVFDDTFSNGNQTASSGTLSVSSAGVTWTGDIGVGGVVTITGSVTVKNPDPGNKVIAPTFVTAAPGSNCPSGGTDPRCGVRVLVLIPALTITKTASVSTTTPGSVVGYTITINNTGQTAYTGATVTDTFKLLDDAAYGDDASATIGAVSYVSPVLTWTGTLAPGQIAVVTYTVTVDNPDTGQNLLINTVDSAAIGSSCQPASSNAGCEVAVPVLTPALTITKTADHATATPGTKVSYTIAVANTGQASYTGATVTDSLAGVLADAAYGNDASATSGAVSYAAPVLTWTGDLAADATATITYTVTIANPDTGGRVLTNTATSTVPGSTCPPASPAEACTATISVIAGSLSITAPASTVLGSAAPGNNLRASLGNVQVIDNRGFGANWTATVSTSAFTTGAGTEPETIPPADASYTIISALAQHTGSATFTFVPLIDLAATPQAVASATNVGGNTTATWNPRITVRIPAGAVAGTYTATITHSVS